MLHHLLEHRRGRFANRLDDWWDRRVLVRQEVDGGVLLHCVLGLPVLLRCQGVVGALHAGDSLAIMVREETEKCGGTGLDSEPLK